MSRNAERQVVIGLIFFMGFFMFGMAIHNPRLWEVDLFKVLIQAVVVTGIIGLVLSSFFAKASDDEEKTANTGKAFEAISAAAKAGTAVDTKPAAEAAREVSDAADEAATAIAEGETSDRAQR